MAFVKGQSGNPGGRPKSSFSLAAACQKYTPEVVELMVKVMRGQVIRRSTRQKGDAETTHQDTPSFQDRIRAAEWLADRGWGKAPSVVAGPGGVGPAEIVVHWGPPPPK